MRWVGRGIAGVLLALFIVLFGVALVLLPAAVPDCQTPARAALEWGDCGRALEIAVGAARAGVADAAAFIAAFEASEQCGRSSPETARQIEGALGTLESLLEERGALGLRPFRGRTIRSQRRAARPAPMFRTSPRCSPNR